MEKTFQYKRYLYIGRISHTFVTSGFAWCNSSAPEGIRVIKEEAGNIILPAYQFSKSQFSYSSFNWISDTSNIILPV